MNTSGLHLLLPEKPDSERDAVAEAFLRCGGGVHRLARFWEPPDLLPKSVRLYGPSSFCLVLQQKLDLHLISPPDNLLLSVPPLFLKRKLTETLLTSLRPDLFPSFVKPLVPKQFRSALYLSAQQLAAECQDLPPETRLLLSEPVRFSAEVRTFVLHGAVLDAANYEGCSVLDEARTFVTELCDAMILPAAVVVDVGFVSGSGWSVVEFNAPWGSGLNGCDADKVLPAILASSAPDSPAS